MFFEKRFLDGATGPGCVKAIGEVVIAGDGRVKNALIADGSMFCDRKKSTAAGCGRLRPDNDDENVLIQRKPAEKHSLG